MKKIGYTVALLAVFSLSSAAHAKKRSGSSSLPFFAEDGINLSSAKCFNPSQYSTREMERALEQAESQGKSTVPCDGEGCFNPHSVSREQSLRIRFLWSAFGVNASHEGYSRARPFTTEELDIIIQAVGLLPQLVLNQIQGAGFVHFTTRTARIPVGINEYETTTPLAWTDSNNVIKIHTRFDQMSSRKKMMVLFHELGHVVANSLRIQETTHSGFPRLSDLDTSETWYQAAGWADYNTNIRPELAASGYARSKYGSAGEDFADSLLRYRLAPQRFLNQLRANNDKYYFIRDHVFQGIEYLNEKECRTDEALRNLDETLDESFQ